MIKAYNVYPQTYSKHSDPSITTALEFLPQPNDSLKPRSAKSSKRTTMPGVQGAHSAASWGAS